MPIRIKTINQPPVDLPIRSLLLNLRQAQQPSLPPANFPPSRREDPPLTQPSLEINLLRDEAAKVELEGGGKPGEDDG